MMSSLASRLWARVEKGDGCWLWTGPRNRAYGAKIRNAVLTEQVVRQVKQRIAEGARQCEVMRELSVPRKLVSAVCRGRTWKHVTAGGCD